YAFEMPEDVYSRFMIAAKKVSKILEKGLKVKRVAMVMEGMGINHAHIKLYPLYGLDEKFKEMWSNESISFDQYQGYISTQTGDKVEISELKKVAEEIRNNLI
ncbi:MAG: diadenosine tetraphosphate hydrolase, partial [Nanoarchaeota archaeon]|nr:diadenosine tetraphosphate hydrolase [Nanoarchaeota archaeon]